jgi:lipoprotein NlpD
VTLARASRRYRCAPVCALAAALLATTACTSTSSVYVPRRETRVAVHVVQRGETLHKIAWQYRLDQRDLIAWNGIREPDELRIGQRLRLVPPRGYVAVARPASQPDAPVAAPPPVPPPTSRAAPAPSRPGAASSSRSRPTPAVRPPPPPAATVPLWAWPTDGRVVATFGARDGIASGIAIGGREGQPVRAAAAGRVVYAGGGLMGYGQLVIIKHDETFLSAYGYNSNVLVTQGQEVARGTTIALMGQGPERQPRLHFEIRRNGVPVDPLLFVRAPG